MTFDAKTGGAAFTFSNCYYFVISPNNTPPVDLWREALSRGYLEVTLRSSPTTRQRRRRCFHFKKVKSLDTPKNEVTYPHVINGLTRMGIRT